jgi:hypothetical protein
MPGRTIKYLRRGEIDTTRWDQCISTASNGLVYAYSFYLDHMSRHWDALVMGDYEAVMPLTWNRKWGISYLYQPAFTASLGVFGNGLTKERVLRMLDAIPKKFRLIEIELNKDNVFDFGFPLRNNFVLDLARPYEDISAGYNDNLRRNLKKASAQQLRYETNIDPDLVLTISEDANRSNYKTSDFKRFSQLCNYLCQRNEALACGVFTEENELAASALFFFSHHRAYYILVGNPAGKRIEGASHFLIDRFIATHASRNMLLDFEGSDIEGLANFYGSFGAQAEQYASLRINRLPWWVKLIKGN